MNFIMRLLCGAAAVLTLCGAPVQSWAEDVPRFSQLSMDQLNDTQKRVAQRILKVSSAGLGGPYSMLLRSPVLAERYLGMTDYRKRRLEAIEISVFEATADVAFCG
jgi:hypothetical protein